MPGTSHAERVLLGRLGAYVLHSKYGPRVLYISDGDVDIVGPVDPGPVSSAPVG